MPGTVYGMSADFPLELLVTETFEEKNGKTQLTLKHAGFPNVEIMQQAKEGWMSGLDVLAKMLTSQVPAAPRPRRPSRPSRAVKRWWPDDFFAAHPDARVPVWSPTPP